MNIILFTKRPDYDGYNNFHNKRDNSGGKRKKKGIAALPAPIFKKKTNK